MASEGVPRLCIYGRGHGVFPVVHHHGNSLWLAGLRPCARRRGDGCARDDRRSEHPRQPVFAAQRTASLCGRHCRQRRGRARHGRPRGAVGAGYRRPRRVAGDGRGRRGGVVHGLRPRAVAGASVESGAFGPVSAVLHSHGFSVRHRPGAVLGRLAGGLRAGAGLRDRLRSAALLGLLGARLAIGDPLSGVAHRLHIGLLHTAGPRDLVIASGRVARHICELFHRRSVVSRYFPGRALERVGEARADEGSNTLLVGLLTKLPVRGALRAGARTPGYSGRQPGAVRVQPSLHSRRHLWIYWRLPQYGVFLAEPRIKESQALPWSVDCLVFQHVVAHRTRSRAAGASLCLRWTALLGWAQVLANLLRAAGTDAAEGGDRQHRLRRGCHEVRRFLHRSFGWLGAGTSEHRG
mmetsp:Transcript_27116/g.90100  ORF Transcript_27116/g.90100 Transcript_27116/m.90100 type:complete len:408 (-) Transcript_27116:1828-3051(-)